jgi:hypothetical protein
MRGQRHRRGAGDRRDEPQAAQRMKGSIRGPGDQRNQRRLVGVAEGRMAAAGDVIKFVAEIAVGAVDPEVQRECQEPQNEFRAVDDGKPAARWKRSNCASLALTRRPSFIWIIRATVVAFASPIALAKLASE